jgi:hypothetical protein
VYDALCGYREPDASATGYREGCCLIEKKYLKNRRQIPSNDGRAGGGRPRKASESLFPRIDII